MPENMTMQEVSDYLRAPVDTLRYWRATNKGPKSFRLGRRVLYSRADVERFVAEAKAAEQETAL